MTLYRFDELVDDVAGLNGGAATVSQIKAHWERCGCPTIWMSFGDFDRMTLLIPNMWQDLCVQLQLFVAIYDVVVERIYFVRNEDIASLITE